MDGKKEKENGWCGAVKGSSLLCFASMFRVSSLLFLFLFPLVFDWTSEPVIFRARTPSSYEISMR